MAKPAARIGDFHKCPASDGGRKHKGGPVLEGSTSVLIGGVGAARVGDAAACKGPKDAVAEGSGSVFIDGRPAARKGDATEHGGRVVAGCSSVLIG